MISCLLQGQTDRTELAKLLSLTGITSARVIEALGYHLVNGYSESMAYQSTGIQQQAFRRALKRLNEVHCIVEDIVTDRVEQRLSVVDENNRQAERATA